MYFLQRLGLKDALFGFLGLMIFCLIFCQYFLWSISRWNRPFFRLKVVNENTSKYAFMVLGKWGNAFKNSGPLLSAPDLIISSVVLSRTRLGRDAF